MPFLSKTTIRLALTAGVWLGTGACLAAQTIGSTGVQSNVLPQSITFAHIKQAMDVNRGSYFVEQIRRRRDPGQPTALSGDREQLLFQASGSTHPARFQLQYVGPESGQLSAGQLALKRARFQRQAAYSFYHRGFRVGDASLAAQSYDLVYLAKDRRVTREDPTGRQVYRFVVLPKRWDRSAWVVELDALTCYPLYSACYSIDQNLAARLESELIVTSYIPGVRIPNSAAIGWWAPKKAIRKEASAGLALSHALPKVKNPVVPQLRQLPSGFALSESRVLTDPRNMEISAVLTFSDGIDTVFVQEREVALAPRGASDELAVFERNGVTQMLFSHGGVEFVVMGRASLRSVRKLSLSIFADAIRQL